MTADPHQPFRSALTRALSATQTLPAPDADARAHSEALCRLIQGEITAAGGAIGVARLVHPGRGPVAGPGIPRTPVASLLHPRTQRRPASAAGAATADARAASGGTGA